MRNLQIQKCTSRDYEDERASEGRPKMKNGTRIKEEPRGVWLVIRYDLADAGIRPVPNGDVFWLSPDIWITGGDELGNAIAGKPTKVHARIWNFGNFQAAPTRVDFAFADPSLGIPWSAPQAIGTAWTTVPALSTTEVDCPRDWVPGPTGTTHACLLVTCSSVPLDPPTNPGNPRTDRHTGQRNVTIVQASAGKQMELSLLVARTLGHRGAVEIAAITALGDGDPQRVTLAAGTLRRALQIQTRVMPAQQTQLLAKRSLVLHDMDLHTRYEVLDSEQVQKLLRVDVDVEPTQARAFAPEDVKSLTKLALLSKPVMIEPLSTRQVKVTLDVPDIDRPLIVHLYQLEDHFVTGGYTVIIHPSKQPQEAKAGLEFQHLSDENQDILQQEEKGGGTMNEPAMNLEQLVIESSPGAQVTYDIVKQLVELIPLQSPEQLKERVGKRGLKAGGTVVTAEQVLASLPADAFPISDTRELVSAVATAIHAAVDVMVQTGRLPENEEQAKFVMALAHQPRKQAEVAVGYFAGPSVFGSERAE